MKVSHKSTKHGIPQTTHYTTGSGASRARKKMLSTGRVVLLTVALGSGVGVSDATLQTVSVTGFGFTFTIVAFDDDRNNPFRLQFTQDGTFSSHTFNNDLFLRRSRVGSERYRVSRSLSWWSSIKI